MQLLLALQCNYYNAVIIGTKENKNVDNIGVKLWKKIRLKLSASNIGAKMQEIPAF